MKKPAKVSVSVPIGDFRLQDCGSIVLVYPRPAARAWLEANTPDDAQWFGPALVVEPRYVVDLVQGLEEAGFRRDPR